jgi:hypothetical protein
MEDQKYYIKISPEVILSDYTSVIYTASTGVTITIDEECCDFTSFTENFYYTTGQTGIILSMQDVLTGGTSGTSLMTGLTIPIMLTQNTVDIGYYSVFDGAILQKDVVTNFLFSASTGAFSSTYYVYNTSDVSYMKFLSNCVFKIDWGDGSQIQTITNFAPEFASHIYPFEPDDYTIKLSGFTSFGVTIIEKKIKVPFTEVDIINPKGTAYFIPQGGSWSGIPISYDYIFSGDSNTNLNDHLSSNYTTVPFIITAFTHSSLTDLSQYFGDSAKGQNSYKLNQSVPVAGGGSGIYLGPTDDGLGVQYIINGVNFYDYPNGITVSVTESSGLTENWLVSSGLTKDETYMNVVDEATIFSNIYIERGKYSALERVRRLGEVSTIGGLTSYGYNFFNVNKNI